jgi:hypothetical protein
MAKIGFMFSIAVLLSGYASAQTPRSIETNLIRRLVAIQRWSNNGQAPDDDKLEAENGSLKKDLLRSANTVATLTYPFGKLKEKMSVVTSKDGRLRIYAWDRQTGGTMRDFDSVYQFRGESGKAYSRAGEGGGFYHDIFQVKTRALPIYLTVSTFIASSTYLSDSISVATIDGDKLVLDSKLIRTSNGLTNEIDFSYDFGSVMDRKERPVKLFTYDEAKRSFSFPIVITDDEFTQGRVTNKLVTYHFNGSEFLRETR